MFDYSTIFQSYHLVQFLMMFSNVVWSSNACKMLYANLTSALVQKDLSNSLCKPHERIGVYACRMICLISRVHWFKMASQMLCAISRSLFQEDSSNALCNFTSTLVQDGLSNALCNLTSALVQEGLSNALSDLTSALVQDGLSNAMCNLTSALVQEGWPGFFKDKR